MELLLQRFSTGDESTLGILHKINDYDTEREFRCFTMEDQPNSPKVPGETRIPAGRYQIEQRTVGGMVKRYRDRFSWHGGMLWLQDVPDFEWIYLHVGNRHENSNGCLLVGDGCQSNVLDDGMVMGSVNAYKRLYLEITEAMAGEDVFITVEDFA